MFSLQQAVRRMGLRLPDPLASPEAIAQIERIADWFPAAITNCFCFELGLSEASTAADFAFLCNRDSTGAEILAGFSEIKLNDKLFSNPVWSYLRDFCRIWMNPNDGSVRDSITHLWIELDHDQDQRIPVPCIFFGLPRNPRMDVASLIPLLETLNFPVSNRLSEFLERCFQSEILENRRISLGLMFSRETDRMRFVFHGMDDEIFRLMSDLDLSIHSDVNTLITALRKLEAHVNLAVDLGDSLGSRVGIECQFADRIRADNPHWVRLLNHLVSINCCDPSKRDALLRWPGGSVERFDHLLWPAKVARKIKHLKLIIEPGSPLQAKAYLFSILEL